MRLTVDSLSKSFGGLRVLEKVSFVAEEHSITALIGPNGAGKTTVFNCVSGFHRADSGQVMLGERSIVGLRPSASLRVGIARTFQLVRTFAGLSVLESVMTAGHWRSGQSLSRTVLGTLSVHTSETRLRAEALATLEALGIDHLADAYTQDLPYGQQRLVEIAKALMTGAETLLLDEPAAGLHENEALALARVLHGIRESGRTVLLVEHNVPFVMALAQKVVVLDFGEVTSVGTPEEVSNDPRVIESYLGRTN